MKLSSGIADRTVDSLFLHLKGRGQLLLKKASWETRKIPPAIFWRLPFQDFSAHEQEFLGVPSKKNNGSLLWRPADYGTNRQSFC